MARVSMRWVEVHCSHSRVTIKKKIAEGQLAAYPPIPPARDAQLDTHDLQRIGWLRPSFDHEGVQMRPATAKPLPMREQLQTLTQHLEDQRQILTSILTAIEAQHETLRQVLQHLMPPDPHAPPRERMRPKKRVTRRTE